jgi:hypothetical protein
LNETIGQIPQPVLITGICILICVVLMLIVLFAWLRARGRFIFVDCIVCNRAAIIEPWKEFRAEGNSFFLFSLLVVLALIAVIVIAGACTHCAVYPLARLGTTRCRILDRPFTVRVCCGLPCFRLGAGLMVPIMYRQRYPARLAFAQAVDLVTSYPGPILLYVLFLLLLGVAMVMISCAVICATCCIAAIP